MKDMAEFKKAWRRKAMNCRIGTTSYIIPGDIIPNLQFLKHAVENIELVIFDSDGRSNLPSKSSILEMSIIARDTGLTYTVHLPANPHAGSTSETKRKKGVEKWLEIMDRMESLLPLGWIVPLRKNCLPPEQWCTEQWAERCGKTIDQLSGAADPESLCIERTALACAAAEYLVNEKNCSACIDIGYMLRTGQDIHACLEKWFDRTRIIHLHGVRSDGRDHVDLGHMETDLLDSLCSGLKNGGGTPRILTLDLFSRKDLERSMHVLQEVIH